MGFSLACGVWLLAACGPSAPADPTAVPLPITPTGAANSGNDNAYPSAGYPANPETPTSYPGALVIGREEILGEPPNPARDLPAAAPGTGVIGGALIREISDEGFMPLNPHELILAIMANNNAGTPVFLRHDEVSQRAETFPTGIFVFRDVPPGRYGLIVGIGITQFPVRTPDGAEVLVDVTPGAVIDLGQVIVQFP